jgi:hypothetical protein
MRKTVLAAGLAAMLGAALLPAAASAALADNATSAQKQDELIGILEQIVPLAEQYWCPNGGAVSAACADAEATYGYGQVPEATGFYAAHGPGVKLGRGEAALAYVYATLLLARPSQARFPNVTGGVSSATVRSRLEQTIRHVMYTNRSLMGSPGWGGTRAEDWQGAIPAYLAGWAAQISWSNLSSDTKRVVEQIVGFQADQIAAVSPQSKTTDGRNSRAEENAWNSSIAAVAAAILPGDSRAATWHATAKSYAVNASSRTADASDTRLVDGTQVRDLVTTQNLEGDYTLVNHGFFHPVYSWAAHQSLADNAVFYGASGAPSQPDAFMFRVAEVWDNVMARLATEDGDFATPVGTDWTTYSYGHLPYSALISTRLQRNDAAVLEARAINNFVERNQIVLNDFDQLGTQADDFRSAAQAWWLHQEFGPAPTPTPTQYQTARAASDGAWQLPDQKAVIGRFAGTVTTMSWNFRSGDTWPTGLVFPDNSNHLDDPALVNPWVTSAVDGANSSTGTWSCDCASDGPYFSTASTINSSTPRRFSMTAFPDGTTLLLDRGAGATASFGFETLPGFTGSRTVRSDSGVGVEGNLSGSWANIGDRFGLVVKGGSGLWADQGDTGAGQPPLWLRGSLDTGSGHRGAAIFPNVTGTTTDALEPDVRQPTVSDSLWSALTAVGANGTGKVAVARWGGGGSATVSRMDSSLGAPIPDGTGVPDVAVSDAGGSMTLSLASPESRGWEAFFFVRSGRGATVTVKRLSSTQIQLSNSAASNAVTVKYDGGAGSVMTASRTLAANETAVAMVYNGSLVIATISASSTEPPGTFAPKLAFDLDTTGASNFWVSNGFDLSRDPQCLMLDFGTAVNLGRATMVPRRGYGPRDYLIQTGRTNTSCAIDRDWTDRARVTGSGDGTTRTHSWTPVAERYFRIKIRAAWGSGPPTFVQVRELTPAPS